MTPHRRLLGLRAAVVLIGTAAALLTMTAPPAAAAPWSVSLTASATSVPGGTSVTLTANASQSVSGTNDYIDIFDQTTGAAIKSCWKGSVCQASVSESGSTHTYVAYVDSDPQPNYPPCCIEATSNTVTVTWTGGGGGTGWSVSLAASATSVAGDTAVTLTATANNDVKNTPYYIDIFDQATGIGVASCSRGSKCQVSVSGSLGAHTYIAYVDGDQFVEYPPCCIQATSNTVTVTWGQATGWSISLAATETDVATDSPVTLTATANKTVTGTGFRIDIDDETTGTVVASCTSGSTCQVEVNRSSSQSHTYVAYVHGDSVSHYPPCCVQAGSGRVTVRWGAPATGVVDVAFNAAGTLPTFPCPRGCEATFSQSGVNGSGVGAVTATGSAEAHDNGGDYAASFAMTTGSLAGTAVYVETASTGCPLNGNATGTVTVSGPATGVIARASASRSSTPAQTGLVTGVTLRLEYGYVRVGLAAVITIKSGTAIISHTLPGTSRTLIASVTGYAPAAFGVNVVEAISDCEIASGAPLDFTVTGNAALALTPPTRGAPATGNRTRSL